MFHLLPQPRWLLLLWGRLERAGLHPDRRLRGWAAWGRSGRAGGGCSSVDRRGRVEVLDARGISRAGGCSVRIHRSRPSRSTFDNSLLWGEAQDLEDGYYQELIAFILFLKRPTKTAFDFSSSAGRDKQFVVGGGLPSPALR